MAPIPFFEVALAFFIGMGPIKILGAYLATTHGASLSVRRAVAIRTVAVATVTALVLLLSGAVLLRIFHISGPALIIASSIVMLAVGLQTVLAPDSADPDSHVASQRDLLRQAVYPLAVPMLLNPAGIAAAMLLSAEVAVLGGLVGSVLVILAIAALDLVVLLVAARAGGGIPREAIVITERIFGMLLVAVAIQLLLVGLGAIGVIDPGAIH